MREREGTRRHWRVEGLQSHNAYNGFILFPSVEKDLGHDLPFEPNSLPTFWLRALTEALKGDYDALKSLLPSKERPREEEADQ